MTNNNEKLQLIINKVHQFKNKSPEVFAEVTIRNFIEQKLGLTIESFQNSESREFLEFNYDIIAYNKTTKFKFISGHYLDNFINISTELVVILKEMTSRVNESLTIKPNELIAFYREDDYIGKLKNELINVTVQDLINKKNDSYKFTIMKAIQERFPMFKALENELNSLFLTYENMRIDLRNSQNSLYVLLESKSDELVLNGERVVYNVENPLDSLDEILNIINTYLQFTDKKFYLNGINIYDDLEKINKVLIYSPFKIKLPHLNQNTLVKSFTLGDFDSLNTINCTIQVKDNQYLLYLEFMKEEIQTLEFDNFNELTETILQLSKDI